MTGCRSAAPITADEAMDGMFWELPSSALAQQWLFRLHARIEDDSVRLRLALRVVGRRDFELEALDSLGRRQWSLRGAEDQILWLDHRERSACRMFDSIALPEALPIPVDPWALARVLLGRAPQRPRSEVTREGNRLDYKDSDGQRWSVDLDSHGEVLSWSGVGQGGREVSWKRGSEESVLVVAGADLELRWRSVARESLRVALAPPTVPDGYREVDCARNR